MVTTDDETEPEYLQEFSSMTTEECQIASNIRDTLKQRFSAEILIQQKEGHPNKVRIYAYTREKLEQATQYYIEQCNND